MLALPRPPARRRTGRPLDASTCAPAFPTEKSQIFYKETSGENVDRQEEEREKTNEPVFSVPNGLGQQPKRDGDSKNEEGEDDIISAYEYGDSEKSDQKGTSTGRRANENGDNEEDVERVVIERESDDGQNVDGEEGRSDNGRGRESEKESISAALLNNHPSQDEAADEGEEQQERAVEREGDRALTTKESSKKKKKQRRKNRHEHRHRSFAHSSKEKKRYNKEDGWFEVAFKGLPFGPDVPGVSQNTIYYSSTRRAELRSSGS